MSDERAYLAFLGRSPSRELNHAAKRVESLPRVLPCFRKQGIGTALMDEAERVIAVRSPIVGVGVGMTQDYGMAQRLYSRRGYIPDGRGLMTHDQPVVYGERILVDDALALYFTKRLNAE